MVFLKFENDRWKAGNLGMVQFFYVVFLQPLTVRYGTVHGSKQASEAGKGCVTAPSVPRLVSFVLASSKLRQFLIAVCIGMHGMYCTCVRGLSCSRNMHDTTPHDTTRNGVVSCRGGVVLRCVALCCVALPVMDRIESNGIE